jgi:hypothetical protein
VARPFRFHCKQSRQWDDMLQAWDYFTGLHGYSQAMNLRSMYPFLDCRKLERVIDGQRHRRLTFELIVLIDHRVRVVGRGAQAGEHEHNPHCLLHYVLRVRVNPFREICGN